MFLKIILTLCYVVTGICGSGGNADCGGYYHKIRCCQANNLLTSVNPELPSQTCAWVTHDAGNEKMLSSCPINYVAAGRCGSGRTADCERDNLPGNVFGKDNVFENFSEIGSWSSNNGNKNHHAVYCCDGEVDVEDGNNDEAWRKGGFGQHIYCPSGYVVTGACGSNDMANCQDVGPPIAGWYHTAIRCHKWSAMPLN